MHFQITVRYGRVRQRYHTYHVEADNARGALESAAADMPPEIASQADLVEVRVASDPDQRRYVEEPTG